MLLRRRLAYLALVWCIVGTTSLGALAWQTPENSRLTGKDQTASVNPGESLYDVARRQGYALEHLAEANRLPVSLAPVSRSSVLVPSRRILPENPPKQGLVVNICERGFYVFDQEKVPRFFPVAVGEPGRFETPTGSYSVREKVVDPEWVAPEWAGLGEDNVIPAGPNNPLGDRWIGLSSRGLGMHSTNNPSSIGSATSHGCMRMYPEVARTVFDLVQTGWPVRIEYQTSRVSVEASGIYGVCFPDPYKKTNRRQQLLDHFRQLDLVGFAGLLNLDKLLSEKSGVVTKLVDLDAKVELDGQSYPAARIGQKVYLEGSTVENLGLTQRFDLPTRSVEVKSEESKVTIPLILEFPKEAEEKVVTVPSAFLSRGTAWYPAKELLAPLAFDYEWDGSQKTLRLSR